eukprot:gnl/MRDRNA2_/MRDRNA2_79450_c0_seq1.p1 gnl/MRDRNA2_/MRDRNA2_79450_c0~~gnl/MRDRNA2_/MRDRNA2_79450_c0_seq1.p1  ORF type:complete len:394 (+),score=65.29 gnl/MRDRNA2_/MRDRNA2_79450_c0_seq1:98-1279(+)
MVRVVVAAVLLAVAHSQSITNCGGSNYHMQNVVMKITPDPPVKGQPLTLSFSGTLDEDFGAGSADVDLQIKALGIIDQQVKQSAPFSIAPAFKKGPQSVTVGPFSLPSNIPGAAVIKGTVKLVNDKSEPVSCSTLNLDLPAMESSAPAETPIDGISCGQPSDHLKNVNISSSGGVLTVSGSLDEAITKMTVNVDLKIHEIFSIPVKLSVPITLSPGLPSGAFKLTGGPSKPGDVEVTARGLSVTGTVKVDDANDQEVCCINVGSSDALSTPLTNPTHYGDPKTGCESDEQAVQVQGISGDFCSPPCKGISSCPTDVPQGVTAHPQCALQTTTGQKYCALICTPSALRGNGATGECGAGSCQAVQGTGICTYPTSEPGLSSVFIMPAEQTQLVI